MTAAKWTAAWIAAAGTPAPCRVLLVCVDTGAGAVGRRHRQRPQFEIGFIDTRIADHIHTQPRQHGRIFPVRGEMYEPAVDLTPLEEAWIVQDFSIKELRILTIMAIEKQGLQR